MATAPKAAPAAVPDATPVEGDAPAPAKSKKKLIVIIGILIAVLGAGGGAGWYFMHKPHAKTAKAASGKIDAETDGKAKADASAEGDADAEEDASAEGKADEEGAGEGKPPVFVVVDPFTVNLQPETGVDQFLQIAFTLQVSDPKQEELVKLYMPQVRSRMLLLLSSKKASELTSTDGKKKLTEEIIAQVKESFLPKGAKQSVVNVFFTSFVIQ